MTDWLRCESKMTGAKKKETQEGKPAVSSQKRLRQPAPSGHTSQYPATWRRLALLLAPERPRTHRVLCSRMCARMCPRMCPRMCSCYRPFHGVLARYSAPLCAPLPSGSQPPQLESRQPSEPCFIHAFACIMPKGAGHGNRLPDPKRIFLRGSV
ncbi:hypothetical protein JCM19237_3713 [Photobacterium aphoticum]|uniref:Uncharacterized protein n=1 Tax=Photobacterium aphoticum TaxID=754436 RepID=A0A090QZN4_9GAMM|nr:hypothetical protein JCM19237_3713 [Photobacterium aphoticum]